MAGSVEGPWPSRAAFDHNGLAVAGTRADELAARFGTPLIVVDETHVRDRCRAFLGAYDRALWAVKAFPAQALIRIAAEEGLGLLAATGGEVDACLRAGVAPREIVFHGNNKLDRELEEAVAAGVGMLVLDNEEEVGRLERVAAEANRVQAVLLRLAPAVEVPAHAYVSTGAPDTKFGMPVAEGIALRALKRALASEHLDVRGVHVHVGSQLLDAEPQVRALEVILAFLEEAKGALGFEARVVDAGGGLGGRYTNERPLEPSALASVVRDRLEAGCRDRGLPLPELWGEPGRAVTVEAAMTLYRVGTIKDVPGIRTYVAVDGGMSDNIRPALYEARYTVALATRTSEAEPVPVTIVGRHCESGDVLARDVSLPGDVVCGDLLAFASTGAYEYAMASTYNKVGRPAVVLVGQGKPRLALRREEEADLARLDAGPISIDESPPPRGVEIRPAQPRDARRLMSLVAEVGAEGRYIRTERVVAPPSVFRRRLRRSWNRDHADLVAVADGRLIGHLGVAREAGPALSHVASLGMVIEREWRGRGVGSALMSEMIGWARWAGIEKVTLSVFPHNRAALALYRKFGFVEEGLLRGHSKKSYGYEDEVVMARWV